MSAQNTKLEFSSLAGLRMDGRKAHEIRRLRVKFDVFSARVDGGVYYEQGNTKLLAIVHGPMEAHRYSQNKKATVNCDFSRASFATSERKVQKQNDRKKMEYSLAIQQIFESIIMTHLYPKTEINIFIEVIQADGGHLSAAINATSLALVDAGIAIRDFVVSCTAAVIDQTFVTDLNYMEEKANCPDLTIALTPKDDQVNLIQMECKLPLDEFEKLMDTATQGCHRIYAILQERVEAHALQALVAREANAML